MRPKDIDHRTAKTGFCRMRNHFLSHINAFDIPSFSPQRRRERPCAAADIERPLALRRRQGCSSDIETSGIGSRLAGKKPAVGYGDAVEKPSMALAMIHVQTILYLVVSAKSG
ncbi:hypothetical protein SPIROBIBN47_200037 [uncultured spirochete]|uniref:Uncharacterized protein n=1 Tax=uncultured spirochete TaxID=156406 RepID=A0A3P3XHF7_9SPIR|nr:hypothetical protein SPIROBIBN47_200037 [uncultured spirochete]